ncbi:MAG: HPr family phosphocarrier protein [Lachnospiraceae bacterium]|nr:HPr family phosphocarrier protein [Lachnospiraceae bacterium]
MGYKRKKIKLDGEEATMFAMVASGCDFDVILSAVRYSCNGKSVEDIRLLDFTKELTIEYNGYDSVFEQYLDRLEAV